MCVGVCGPWGKHSSCSGCDCGILLGRARKREGGEEGDLRQCLPFRGRYARHVKITFAILNT